MLTVLGGLAEFKRSLILARTARDAAELLHAIVHPADIQDRDDGGILLLATLFGMYPFLQTLFANAGYHGPQFQNAAKAS
jgi:hypothetical protein